MRSTPPCKVCVGVQMRSRFMPRARLACVAMGLRQRIGALIYDWPRYRRALRSGLYMAALSATRHNPILSSFYQRLRAKGKPHKLALTAVMRKLLLALNSTLKPIACSA